MLLHDYTDEALNEGDGEAKAKNFEDDLDVLRGYSLVNISTTLGFCEMHSLVQSCMQVWLSRSDELMRWKRLLLRLAWKHFPGGAFETWATCQILLPHIQCVVDEKPLDESDILQWTQLLTKVSWYMIVLGDYFKAETTARRAVSESKRILGGEHIDTLSRMGNLALTYLHQGRWEEAESLEVHVMETRKTKLGADHPHTLTSMANLAFTLKGLSRLDEAIVLMRDCVRLQQRIIGLEHPYTVSSVETLERWEQELG